MADKISVMISEEEVDRKIEELGKIIASNGFSLVYGAGATGVTGSGVSLGDFGNGGIRCLAEA